MDEIDLQNPVLDEDALLGTEGGQKNYWVSYYPIICYLAKDDQGKPGRLIFHNLVDQSSKPEVRDLSEGEQFIAFVGTNMFKSSAIISVLVRKESSYLVRTFTYDRPFEKKDLRDDSLWVTNETIHLDNSIHPALAK